MVLAMSFIGLVHANRAKKLIHGPRDDKTRGKKKKISGEKKNTNEEERDV